MPKDLKHIIMETVDPRDYLEGKVKTGGIVNSERAVKAAEFALFYPMELAIEKARDVILPLEKDFSGVAKSQYFPGLVLPLTPMFKL